LETVKEKEAKELKKVKSAERASHKVEPISQTIQTAKEEKQTAIGVAKHPQVAIDQFDEMGNVVINKYTGQILPTSRNKDGE